MANVGGRPPGKTLKTLRLERDAMLASETEDQRKHREQNEQAKKVAFFIPRAYAASAAQTALVDQG
jgi:hypothetical protein